MRWQILVYVMTATKKIGKVLWQTATSFKIFYFQCRRRVKIIGGAHHERQSHEVLGSPGECSLGKFLYRGSLK